MMYSFAKTFLFVNYIDLSGLFDIHVMKLYKQKFKQARNGRVVEK